MRATRVGDAELRQAKALLLHETSLAEASVESIAQGLLWRASEGLPLDEPTRAARKYAELTAEAVRAAFASGFGLRTSSR
jgi:zinc protease